MERGLRAPFSVPGDREPVVRGPNDPHGMGRGAAAATPGR